MDTFGRHVHIFKFYGHVIKSGLFCGHELYKKWNVSYPSNPALLSVSPIPRFPVSALKCP